MNRKVLIVGGTSGLGRELANLYCRENNIVGIVGRRQELLNDFLKQYPQNGKALRADISSETITNDLTKFIGEFGSIDIFIFTASIIHFNDQLSTEKETATIDINITGFLRIIHLAYAHCKKNNGGQIAVVTSVAQARGNKTAPAYNASKAFQAKYTEGLRLKAKAEKLPISITEIIPGYIDTGMAKGDRLFWMASVNKAARQTKKAIEKKKRRSWITPRWWWVFQAQRLMPSFIYERLTNSTITLKKK